MKKRLTLFISVIVVLALSAGCTKAAGPATKTTAKTTTKTTASNSKKPLDPSFKQYITEAKTSYFVPAENGEHEYLKEGHPMVQEVSSIVKDFCRYVSNRDYRNDDGKKEYKYYTSSVVQGLLKKNDPENTLARLKKDQIVQKIEDTKVVAAMFADSGKAAQVAFVNKIWWESASPAFLSKNKVSLNTVYKMDGVAVLVKEGSQWKFTGVRFSQPVPAK